MCEECALIAHDRCTPNAPPTCGLRAQLLQYASYSPSPDSPNPLDVIQRLTPTRSPAGDGSTVFSSNTSAHATELDSSSPNPNQPPPTSFKMFGAFKRSRSSLSVDPSAVSRDGSAESVQTRAGKSSPSPVMPSVTGGNARRPKLLKKGDHHRPRPLSISSEGTTPNRSSLRSAGTGDSGDMDNSDGSRSHSHSHSQSRSPSHSQPRSRTGAVSFVSDADTAYAPSRMSMAVSAPDSQDHRRRASLYGAESTVGEMSEYGDAEDDEPIAERERTEGRWRRRPQNPGEKEKGCIVQ